MQSHTNSNIYDNTTNTLNRLTAKLVRLLPDAGRYNTAIEGLSLSRWNDNTQTDTSFYAPSIGIIIQGHKQSLIGSELFTYGAGDCLVNGVNMPSSSKTVAASLEKPLLVVSLAIDKNLATRLATEIPPVTAPTTEQQLCLSVAKVPADVLDAFARLVDMLDTPEQIPLLAPLLKREAIVRVLIGPQGGVLRTIYTHGSHSNQVAKAINWLHANYTHPLDIKTLAENVDMATSTFHRQFKKITSISPLQFQKCLRLYEAQRLMLTASMDANNAARAVGYDSVQQFNREYKRQFGEPPHRHVQTIRQL